MTKVATLIADYDAYDPQHPTVQESTGYKFEIASHSIYFDY